MEALKILVVDDESRMRKLVRDFLTKSGYEVLEAENGAQAVDIFFEKQDIALIILDVMMPVMDGWQVCREIRAYSQVPIIMLTAKTDERDELQRIFENYAVIWATLSYDTDAVSRLSDDVHSPAEIRVNAVLSATDKFYSAYDITEDDKMYVAPDKRLRIW